MTDRCMLCGLPLFEPHTAVVEVTEHGTVIRKAAFYWLHALCGDDWAQSEMKRLREVYRHQPDFSLGFRVELMP
jgi:hypothetical protein